MIVILPSALFPACHLNHVTMDRLTSTIARRTILAGAMLCVFASWGCGGDQQSPRPIAKPDVRRSSPAQPAERQQPTPPVAIDWNVRLDEIDEQLAANDFDAARSSLAAANESFEKLNDQQQRRLSQLHEAFDVQLQLRNHERRDVLLEESARYFAQGDLPAARKAVDDVLCSVPTADQQQRAEKLLESIEVAIRTRRELMPHIRSLESDDRDAVRTARSHLLAEAEVALPMLLQALRSDNPRLVANSLEVLRVFNYPDRVVPGILGVLENPRQSAAWPAAIREVRRLAYPGAGPRLLALALELEPVAANRACCGGAAFGVVAPILACLGEMPCQQVAVLNALAVCNDPPPETVVVLLPLVFRDGRSLAPAIRAICHAAQFHDQTDLAAMGNLPGDMVDGQVAAHLAALPARLQEIIARSPDNPSTPERDAALVLAIVTGQIDAPVLPVKEVSHSSYSSEEAPATAAVDGHWNVVDVRQMWQYPSGKRPLIVLDLGEVRTVSGVRIWNYNLPGKTHRGWKDVDLFVSETRSLVNPVAQGQVPMAPGRMDSTDYGVTLPVPFVRGRYIKIEPRSVWRDDGASGVTEIQVLGF